MATYCCIPALKKWLTCPQQKAMIRIHHVSLLLRFLSGFIIIRIIIRIIRLGIEGFLWWGLNKSLFNQFLTCNKIYLTYSSCNPGRQPHLFVWVNKLWSGISCEHMDDSNLTPLINVYQQVTQFAVVFVNQIYSLWANILKSHNSTACNKLLNNVITLL